METPKEMCSLKLNKLRLKLQKNKEELLYLEQHIEEEEQ